jgi:hypothetical protein
VRSELTGADRRDARVALAMLPVGAVVFVGSAVALVVVVGLALIAPFSARGALLPVELWCLFAAAVAVWNGRKGIEIMSAFDWRPLPWVVLSSAAVVAAWLALP